jgi:hypothetical protein
LPRGALGEGTAPRDDERRAEVLEHDPGGWSSRLKKLGGEDSVAKSLSSLRATAVITTSVLLAPYGARADGSRVGVFLDAEHPAVDASYG